MFKSVPTRFVVILVYNAFQFTGVDFGVYPLKPPDSVLGDGVNQSPVWTVGPWSAVMYLVIADLL
jgi:hypothetical protein